MQLIKLTPKYWDQCFVYCNCPLQLVKVLCTFEWIIGPFKTLSPSSRSIQYDNTGVLIQLPKSWKSKRFNNPFISLSFKNIQTGNLNSNEGIEGWLWTQLNIYKKLFPPLHMVKNCLGNQKVLKGYYLIH